MQIVIDIPEKVYKSIQGNEYCGIIDSDMYNAIANGTPLPKGHGRLIDADKIKFEYLFQNNEWIATEALIDNQQTIIEADKEVGE